MAFHPISGKSYLLPLLLLCASLCAAQNAVPVVLAPVPQLQFFDQSGRPLAFGCVSTFQSQTTTPLATYSDFTGQFQNQNPVLLSAGGSANIWLQSGQAYTLTVKSSGGDRCALGQTLYTIDGVGGGASQLNTVVTPSGGSAAFTVQSQNQIFSLTLTGNVAGSPVSFIGVIAPALVTFQITEDGAGAHTFTWPSNVIGAAPIDTVANHTTSQTFIWNGTSIMPVGSGFTSNGNSILPGNAIAPSINNVIYVDGNKYPCSDAGITAAESALPSTGGVVDARGCQGTMAWAATLTVGSSSQPVRLVLGAVTITAAGAPCVLVPGASVIEGISPIATHIDCTASATDMIDWNGSHGGIRNVAFNATQTNTKGLVLDANAAGASIEFNLFEHLRLTATSGSTADAVRMNAKDATHLVSFNDFVSPETIDFLNVWHWTTSGAVGPTDNHVFGGQYRRTTAASGNGVLCDNGQDNKIYGGNYSVFGTAFNLNNAACVDNQFISATPESNTNALAVVSGAADNAFFGIPIGSQGFSNSGTRTALLGNGNNAIGPGGAVAQMQGAPFLNFSAVSVNNDSAGFKHKRFGATCSTTTTIANTCTTTYSWTTAFADANYTPVCTGVGPTQGGILAINSFNASGVTVIVFTTTAASASYSGVDCVAVHD